MGLESRPPGSSVKEGEMVTQQDLLLERVQPNTTQQSLWSLFFYMAWFFTGSYFLVLMNYERLIN